MYNERILIAHRQVAHLLTPVVFCMHHPVVFWNGAWKCFPASPKAEIVPLPSPRFLFHCPYPGHDNLLLAAVQQAHQGRRIAVMNFAKEAISWAIALISKVTLIIFMVFSSFCPPWLAWHERNQEPVFRTERARPRRRAAGRSCTSAARKRAALKVFHDRLEKSESRQRRQTGEALIVAERFTESPNGQTFHPSKSLIIASKFMATKTITPTAKAFFPILLFFFFRVFIDTRAMPTIDQVMPHMSSPR